MKRQDQPWKVEILKMRFQLQNTTGQAGQFRARWRREMVMYKSLVIMILLIPALAHAKPKVDHSTGAVVNDDGSYSLSRFFSLNETNSPLTIDNEAETFCANRGKYYYHLTTEAGAHLWTLTFKCITDKKEAETQKRLREIPLDGKRKR